MEIRIKGRLGLMLFSALRLWLVGKAAWTRPALLPPPVLCAEAKWGHRSFLVPMLSQSSEALQCSVWDGHHPPRWPLEWKGFCWVASQRNKHWLPLCMSSESPMALWPLLWTEQVRESTSSTALELVQTEYLCPLSLVLFRKKETGHSGVVAGGGYVGVVRHPGDGWASLKKWTSQN